MRNLGQEQTGERPVLFPESFLRAQRKRLETEKERLEEELTHRSRKVNHGRETFAADFEDLGSDQDSNIAEVESYEANLATVSALKSEHAKVEAALKRLDNGTYGLDTKSGQPIRRARLEAFPAAEFDINGENH